MFTFLLFKPIVFAIWALLIWFWRHCTKKHGQVNTLFLLLTQSQAEKNSFLSGIVLNMVFLMVADSLEIWWDKYLTVGSALGFQGRGRGDLSANIARILIITKYSVFALPFQNMLLFWQYYSSSSIQHSHLVCILWHFLYYDHSPCHIHPPCCHCQVP